MSSASELPGPRFAPASVDASHQIALEIRRYLEREGLQPGDRIGTEQELAAEFGVSRPTLREGLRLLASSHLIRVGRGFPRWDRRPERASGACGRGRRASCGT